MRVSKSPFPYSSPESSFASSKKLMRTTMLDPARPTKNIALQNVHSPNRKLHGNDCSLLSGTILD